MAGSRQVESPEKQTEKGGTSLSKVFGAIERFSEDIDLAIIPASLGWKESDLDQAPSRTKREEHMAGLLRVLRQHELRQQHHPFSWKSRLRC
uniref:nucleotidyl transferase AbiEii/AbiGii toxin family protein n=1 Tax=Cephaloticoccus sp. TaxID=1985742 RepID=UPI004049D3F6